MKAKQRNSKILLSGTLISRVCYFMSVPYLAIYLSQKAGFTPAEVGLIVGVNPLLSVLCSFFSGKIVDRIALKKLLMAVPIVWGVIFLGISLAENFSQFLLLNAANGICYVLYEPACKKALSLSGGKKRLLLFNLRYGAINLGAVCGPLLNSFFHLEQIVQPYLFLSLAYIVVGIENLFLVEDSLQIPAEKKFTKENPRPNFKLKKSFIWLLLGVACSYFGYSQLNSTIAQFLTWRSPEGGELYSLLLSLSAILIILLQFPILKISSQRSSSSVLLLSNLLFAGSLLTVLQFPNLFWLLLFIAGYSLAELLLGARFDYAVDQLAQEHEKGVYFSISEVVKIGSTLGPIVSGNLISLWGWHNSLLIFLLLAGLTVCGSFFLGRVE